MSHLMEIVDYKGVAHMKVKPADFFMRSSIIKETIESGRSLAINLATGELTTISSGAFITRKMLINKYRFEVYINGIIHKLDEKMSKAEIVSFVSKAYDSPENNHVMFFAYLNKPNKLVKTISTVDYGSFLANVLAYVAGLSFEKIAA